MSAKNGKPCVKCGANEWSKSGNCVPCAKVRGRKYYEKNAKERIEYSRRWREENPERRKENRKREYARDSEKAKANARQWGKDNRERKRDTNNKWYQTNKEKSDEMHRQWIKRNRDKMNFALRRWRHNNPGAEAASKNRRRARIANTGGGYTATEWKELTAAYNYQCLCCGRSDVELTADHVIPVSKGGTSNIDNIQPLCRSCNSRKHVDIIDYRPHKQIDRWRQRGLFD